MPRLRPELVVQTSNDAYSRPRGGTPVRLALVPAYAQCTPGAANRVHGPPLEHPSCNPPAQESSNVTVGSPDANGRPANSSGYALMGVIVGNPTSPEDEADVSFTFQLSDVRSRGGLFDDYAGELQFRPTLRLTDRESAVTGGNTLQDLALPVTVPCTPTLDPLTGSDCHLATTFDASRRGWWTREHARSGSSRAPKCSTVGPTGTSIPPETPSLRGRASSSPRADLLLGSLRPDSPIVCVGQG